jgi:hypothetical protein
MAPPAGDPGARRVGRHPADYDSPASRNC